MTTNDYFATDIFHTRDDLADKVIELQHTAEELANLFRTIDDAICQAEQLVDYHRDELGIDQVILADADTLEETAMEIECAADDMEIACNALPDVVLLAQDLIRCEHCKGTSFHAVPMLAAPLGTAYTFGTSIECDCGHVLRFTEGLLENGAA
jgi:hypothetical protein